MDFIFQIDCTLFIFRWFSRSVDEVVPLQFCLWSSRIWSWKLSQILVEEYFIHQHIVPCWRNGNNPNNSYYFFKIC